MERLLKCLVQRRAKLLCLFAITLMLGGCIRTAVSELKPEQTITHYTITVLATREANVNAVDQSVPLKINVFNLRSDTGFMNADYFALHNKTAEVLGNNLLGGEKLFLLPGGKAVGISGEKRSERYYVGITGEFQTLNNKTWRIIIPIVDPEIPPFYQFWRSAPSQQKIDVIADRQGLHLAEKRHKK